MKDFHNGPAPGAKADAQACQAIGLGQGTQDEEMIGISHKGEGRIFLSIRSPIGKFNVGFIHDDKGIDAADDFFHHLPRIIGSPSDYWGY